MVGSRNDDGYQRQGGSFNTLPCFESAQVEVSEFMGLMVLILNIMSAGLGTFVSGFVDHKGLNCAAIILGIV